MTRTRARASSPRIPRAMARFPRVVAPPVKKLVRRSWTVWVEGEPREEVRLLTERGAVLAAVPAPDEQGRGEGEDE